MAGCKDCALVLQRWATFQKQWISLSTRMWPKIWNCVNWTIMTSHAGLLLRCQISDGVRWHMWSRGAGWTGGKTNTIPQRPQTFCLLWALFVWPVGLNNCTQTQHDCISACVTRWLLCVYWHDIRFSRGTRYVVREGALRNVFISLWKKGETGWDSHRNYIYRIMYSIWFKHYTNASFLYKWFIMLVLRSALKKIKVRNSNYFECIIKKYFQSLFINDL